MPPSLDSAEISKAALGQHSPVDQKLALEMVTEALRLVKGRGRLIEAADLMEEAFNTQPDLRERYEYQVRLWRRGVAM